MILSIITVNRNNSEGLFNTLKSVNGQTFTDFEYIVVDGLSTDGSLELIQQFKSSTNLPFDYVSECDSGVYEAMNKGIRLAKGEYLLFLNSGDFLVNDNVLGEVFAVEHSADFLLGCCNVSDSGIIRHTTKPPSVLTFGYLYEAGLAHQSTFISREMFTKFGMYREDFKYNADVEFWYRTIVMQSCSTETLSSIISDYNTDGISSRECQTQAYLDELHEIYSHPLLQLFIPDYDAMKVDRQKMQILYWVKSKKILYGLLRSIYYLSCFLVDIRKKLFSKSF